MSTTSQLYVVCPEDVLDGVDITKEKRHELFGKVDGGAGSCNPEVYQREKIVQGTGLPCSKTNIRIHLVHNTLHNLPHPNKEIDGFDYSEDFDGVQKVDTKTVYINLKCIVGKGGVQTRSLREVYWFMKGQLYALENNPDIYFANILDGDEAARNMSKFTYLLSLPEFQQVKEKVYVGDLKGYFPWFQKQFGEEIPT